MFKLTIEVSETGLNTQTHQELPRLIDDVKPVSRHYTLAISITPTGNMHCFGGIQLGEKDSGLSKITTKKLDLG